MLESAEKPSAPAPQDTVVGLPLRLPGWGTEQPTPESPTLAQLREAFGIQDKPIDTALRRLHTWALVSIAGAINLVKVDGVIYSWDARPRRLKNGALEGRVYAQRRGEAPRDIGGFKIGADGHVLKIPPELAAVLPGCANATTEEEPS